MPGTRPFSLLTTATRSQPSRASLLGRSPASPAFVTGLVPHCPRVQGPLDCGRARGGNCWALEPQFSLIRERRWFSGGSILIYTLTAHARQRPTASPACGGLEPRRVNSHLWVVRLAFLGQPCPAFQPGFSASQTASVESGFIARPTFLGPFWYGFIYSRRGD